MPLSSNWARRALTSAAAAIALAALNNVAAAQLTSAQQSALRSNCTSDFMSKCSGVTPGSKDALVCLQKNVATLSPSCQTAVRATIPAAAPPQAAQATAVAAPAPMQPTAAQQSAMKQACQSDFMSRCAGVSPGGKDAFVCLQRNVAVLSPACKQAVSATLPAGAAATPTVAVTPAAGPTPQQMSALKHTCGRDFKLHCRGVTPGGPEALACLQRNAPRLTPNCKTSLADIAQSTTIAEVPAAAAAPAAAPARRLPPGITPAGRIMRRVMERNQ